MDGHKLRVEFNKIYRGIEYNLQLCKRPGPHAVFLALLYKTNLYSLANAQSLSLSLRMNFRANVCNCFYLQRDDFAHSSLELYLTLYGIAGPTYTVMMQIDARYLSTHFLNAQKRFTGSKTCQLLPPQYVFLVTTSCG